MSSEKLSSFKNRFTQENTALTRLFRGIPRLRRVYLQGPSQSGTVFYTALKSGYPRENGAVRRMSWRAECAILYFWDLIYDKRGGLSIYISCINKLCYYFIVYNIDKCFHGRFMWTLSRWNDCYFCVKTHLRRYWRSTDRWTPYPLWDVFLPLA